MLELEAIDRIEHILTVVGWRLHYSGRGSKRDNAQAHASRQSDDKISCGLLRGTDPSGSHVG
ncbi:hypothetical protein CBM2605_B70022 [Cupriavidus neocaledonicus]|uniref:Transposase n=1 Tax=Cupriavidus neocaledonicus TaxID=1040979 RepID=A0ABY1VBZ5_9BURK|nr:hypothetical protein CBM2605_B70022 [Cupriavidus neocaledonicus]